MLKTLTILLTLALAAGFGTALAYGQTGNGNGVCEFIDEDGDGFNDLAPDDDGDGIPNRLDPDYSPAQDGEGNQFGWGRYARLFQMAFGQAAMNQGPSEDGGYQFGPGEGSGLGEGPGDHTGFGPGSGDGTGDGVDVGGRAQRRGGQR